MQNYCVLFFYINSYMYRQPKNFEYVGGSIWSGNFITDCQLECLISPIYCSYLYV